jgi:uncharacterized membrane protein YeaQ/YmgE (transglycosylase-associated protein family)
MILTWVVFGLVVGLVARLLVPGRQSIGIVGTMALGIAGSFIGGLLGNVVFGAALLQIHAAGFLGSILGATLLLGIVQMLRR